MGLTSHIYCCYDTFYFYRIFSVLMSLTMISLMMSLTTMVLGPVYLVRALFHFLKITLVVSVDNFYLFESMKYFHLVKSFEYFLVESNLFESNLVESNLVESIEYFPAQKHS